MARLKESLEKPHYNKPQLLGRYAAKWLRLLFVSHGSLIKFPEASARPVEYDIEMRDRQSQVCANLFLVIIGDIEAVKRLDVPFVRHLFEDLPDEIGLLFLQ